MPDKPWSVYLIRCADKSLYCGISIDVARRFQEHQSMSAKTAKYLRGRGPLDLVFQQEIGNRSVTSRVESLIKGLNKAQKESLVHQQDLSLFIEIPA